MIRRIKIIIIIIIILMIRRIKIIIIVIILMIRRIKIIIIYSEGKFISYNWVFNNIQRIKHTPRWFCILLSGFFNNVLLSGLGAAKPAKRMNLCVDCLRRKEHSLPL